MKKTVSVVLGSFNRLPFLKAAIRSIRENDIRVAYEILVVDGGSTDGSLGWLFKQKDILTIVQHNHGTYNGKPVPRQSWGYFMNLAFKTAQGEYLCMISDDSLLIPHAIMNGIAEIELAQSHGKKIGAAAFYWRNNWPDDKAYMVSRTVNKLPFVNHGLFVRSAVEEVGWIEEQRYQFYCADIDLCLRLHHSGHEILTAPNSFVEHYFYATPSGRQNISEKKLADDLAFCQVWSTIYPGTTIENMVLQPLFLQYEDSTRTGYRLYPRGEILKIKVFLLMRRIIHHLQGFLFMIKRKE